MSHQEAAVKFKTDFERNDPDRPTMVIQVNAAGQARINHVIPKSNGESMEQLLDETFPRLEEYYQLLAANPPAPEKFRLMQASLIEDADEAYRRLVDRNYSTLADKTPANYTQSKLDLVTELS